MFATTDKKEHAHQKRLIQTAFAKRYVLHSRTRCETIQVLLSKRLLPRLERATCHGTLIDIRDLSEAYSMDALTTYQFGLSSGTNFIDDTTRREWYWHHFYRSRRLYLFIETQAASLLALLSRMGIDVITKRIREATAKLETWNLNMCDQAESLLLHPEGIREADYPLIYQQQRQALHQISAGKASVNPNLPISTDPCRFEIASNMLDYNNAAHEDSGDILTYIHYELARNPGLQERLRQELTTLNPPMVFSGEETMMDLPHAEEVDRLPLLNGIILETLRLRVPRVQLQARLTSGIPCSFAGYDIPQNVRVHCSPYLFHRDPKVFPEPEVWKPERWIKASLEESDAMEASFWPFGKGDRACIGQHIAVHGMSGDPENGNGKALIQN
jgi:cytochrome P450